MLKVVSPTDVDFWVDFDNYSNLISKTDTSIFTIDMIRLVSIRKSISNFVRILTQKNIPVYFNSDDKNANFGGKNIYLSAKIHSKQDFEVAVGQALHESGHSLKTNFDLVKRMFFNIPRNILQLSDSKNISRQSLEKFIHLIWNVIEDRFIDDYVFNEAPGYRGYYVSLYNRYWNSNEVDIILKDPHLFRYPSLDSYAFRIINFTNINTELDALPRLDEIANTIDITNIKRLKLTRDRVSVAFDVVAIVLSCLDNTTASTKNDISDKKASMEDYFEFDDSSGSGSAESVDISKKAMEEIGNIIKGDVIPNKPHDIVNKISSRDIDNNLQSKIDNIVDTQQKFIFGEIEKEALDSKEKQMLDVIERHGIEVVKVDVPGILMKNNSGLKVDCIVVQEMTSQLIFSGKDMFPLSLYHNFGSNDPEPNSDNLDSILKGIALGNKLGRSLQIRTESNPIKTIRKKSGKINTRQLHEASFDSDSIFYKKIIEQYNNASLHISIDASSSMAGKKWNKTMTSVTAICKAASMISNVHITVSIRTTIMSNGIHVPYIVMAYDSRKDSFSKIRKLFPYLSPSGLTPEGLSFGSIMNMFNNITPDEEDRYLLNFSDGEPCYELKVPLTKETIAYIGDIAVNHTKSQIDKIRRNGVNILSYFIYSGDDHKSSISVNKYQFGRMYGKDAKFIDVEDVIDLATTINNLFLSKHDEND